MPNGGALGLDQGRHPSRLQAIDVKPGDFIYLQVWLRESDAHYDITNVEFTVTRLDAPGTWDLTRIFRAGASPTSRSVPIDSTVFVRITLETHVGDWISGRLYRRYHGEPDGSKVEAGPLRGTGRWIIGVELEKPAWTRARTAAWPGEAVSIR